MKLIVIKNLTKRPISFLLLHQVVCVKLGQCLCKDGIPKSVHISVGAEATTNEEIIETDEFKKAKKKKEISIRNVIIKNKKMTTAKKVDTIGKAGRNRKLGSRKN